MDLASQQCTCSHSTVCEGVFVATNQVTVLQHRNYSPEIASNEFFLFQKLKEILKGRHFDDIDDIRGSTMAAL